jgi:hypothetical protein
MSGWKNVLQSVAPVLATALGGPLAGAAVKVLSNSIFGHENADQTEVSEAVMNGLSPDAIVKLREVDVAFKTRMRELDIDIARLNASSEMAYLADTQNARTAHAGNDGVFWLGIAILLTFACAIAAVLVGSFEMLTGGITIKDVGTVATVSGLVGTVIGYVAANAQQVVGYFFGSSKGSADKTTALSNAVRDAMVTNPGGPNNSIKTSKADEK